jgi:hypothetical protein
MHSPNAWTRIRSLYAELRTLRIEATGLLQLVVEFVCLLNKQEDNVCAQQTHFRRLEDM